MQLLLALYQNERYIIERRFITRTILKDVC